MRAGSIALVLTGLLASSSAVGIVLWNSHQAGSDEVVPEVDESAEAQAGDTASEAFSDTRPALAMLQSEKDLLNVIQAFDSAAHAEQQQPANNVIRPIPKSLWLDMGGGVTHVQEGASNGTGTASLSRSSPAPVGALSASLPMRSVGGNGGTSKNFNPGFNGTDPADEPNSPDEQEQCGQEQAEQEQCGQEQGGQGQGEQGSSPSTSDPHDEVDGSPTQPTGPNNPGDLPDHPDLNPPVTVPEPGTLGLLVMGAAGMLFSRRKRRVQG